MCPTFGNNFISVYHSSLDYDIKPYGLV